jgi:hypothetical protein
MEIIVNKKTILTKFLIPISKFTDQATLTLTKDSIHCVSYSTSEKQTVILYTKLDVKTDTTENEIILNIGSVKRLINAFNCISEDIIKLIIDSNSISYISASTNFKFHLKEDGTIEKAPISLDKIAQIQYNTTLTNDKINEILQASNFSAETNKVYIYLKDNNLYGEMTDKTIQNLDSMTVLLSDAVMGDRLSEMIALKIDIFKIISTLKMPTLTVKINTKGVIMFEIKEADFLLQYITSSLVK